MALTDAQYTTLADHIRASSDPDVVAALAIRNDTEITRLYNLDSAVYVWKTTVTPSEYRGAMVWTQVDQMTAGNARIWEWITANMTLNLDASDPNVRQGILDAFSGQTLTNLTAVAKRISSLYESLYATGTGTEANPSLLVLEGPLTTQIVGKALNEF